MKKAIIKLFDKIIILLLGLSGILYSCAKYGMPVDEYEIKGTVTDISNTPIKDIRIIREKIYDKNDTIFTDAQGKYNYNFYNERYDPMYLIVDDIDGEANGGEFISTQISVDFTDAELVRKARGNKRSAKYVKTQNIRLFREGEVTVEYGPPPAPFEP